MRTDTNMRCEIALQVKVVRTACMAVWETMCNRFIPTHERKLRSIAQGFNKHANFPNCVGAADGNLIRIEKPG
jgi:hypothetical protein